ncbi:hypothetical protein F5148DRAFT_985074 [Russula earlei]|uniref:Uncharacterized protein n=1 Tax=Russula earlei TaxID=71964 RepID=A0ACC0TZ47_9AGAM|nr:hypothetical protein F5148DRAFT_985074 [Russula earlei]
MSAFTFTFDFDFEDDLDESFDAVPLQQTATGPSAGSDKRSTSKGEPVRELSAEEIPLSSLISTLPEALSYSPVTLPAPSGHKLVRRDLFDARFQLLAQGDDRRDERTAAFVDAPADLVPGAYEGGLKTWECALDLAAYLDHDVLGGCDPAAGRRVRGLRVIELGCGTAVPTLLLLDRLFAHLAFGARARPEQEETETDVHLQDYNRSVLELVTFPNILLTWYMSPLSASYRASSSDSDDDDGEERGEAAARGRAAHADGHGRGPGGLTVTPGLLSAFTASLDAHKVRLRFFAGGWASLRELLLAPRRTVTPPPPPYDIVLASETIYRTETLDPFLGVLRAAAARAPHKPVADAEVRCDQGEEEEEELATRPPLCLVAAKVLYFGVGGGVHGFVRAVEEDNGTVRTVWEHREGVRRMIMRIKW